VLGACIGAALAGLRPIGEMQFNDFVATGFNQLVNNAAKIRYRWGGSVPMVVRMPWGGLRHAGPYHSQNTEPWFYRTPGLKIVVPSTPTTRARSWRRPSPIRIPFCTTSTSRSTAIPRSSRSSMPIVPRRYRWGRPRSGAPATTLAIISYGAYVHAAMRVLDDSARRASRRASSISVGSRRSISTPSSRSRAAPAASSSSTKTRAPGDRRIARRHDPGTRLRMARRPHSHRCRP
jgi:pyruvate/2-oxoglutarate/acetoin dehydrogenase E1 component